MPLLVMSMPDREPWIMQGNRLSTERWFPMKDVARIEVCSSLQFGYALLRALMPFQGEEPVVLWLDDMWLSAKLSEFVLDESYWMIENGARSGKKPSC